MALCDRAGAEEISQYATIFDHLRAEALGISQSIQLISRIADEIA